MNHKMSQEYVTAFITTCFDAGLSEKSASELLRRESVALAADENPAWAEGYRSVLGDGELPVDEVLGWEKSAGAPKPQHLRSIGSHLGGIAGDLWGIVRGTGRKARSGVKAVYNRNDPKSLLTKYPLTTTLGTAGAASAGTAGVYSFLNRDSGYEPRGMSDPFFSQSGRDPSKDEKMYQDRLYNTYAPGIFSINREFNEAQKRIPELEAAVKNHTGGGNAYRDLQELKRRRESIGKQRDYGYEKMQDARNYNLGITKDLEDRRRSLESSRTSLWKAPYRQWLRLTGRDPKQHYDMEIARMEDRATNAAREARMLQDRMRLLDVNATGRRQPTPASPDAMQRKFFPPQ